MTHEGKTLGKTLGKGIGIPIEIDLSRAHLDKRLLVHACNIERYILYNGVYTGPFAADEPAWRYVNIPGYGSVPLLQVERTDVNLFEYSRAFEESGSWAASDCTPNDNSIANPVGGEITACLLQENSDNDNHYLQQNVSVDGSSAYCFSLFKKAKERYKARTYLNTAGFTSNCYIDVNLSTGVIYDNAGTVNFDIEAYGNGWYRTYFSGDSDVAISNPFRIYILDDVGSNSYQGDGSSGLYIFGAQLGKLLWASSPITTEGGTEARPIVTAQINAANVPGWMKSRFIIPWIPYGSSTQFSTTDHILCEMRDSVEDWTLYIKGSTGEVILTGSVTGDILTKSAITFSALGDPILFDFTLNNGSVASLTVSGADTGDGTQAASQAISFDGNYHVGTDHTGGNEADGLVWVIKP